MSDHHSPGDRRQAYSDKGGPEGRHAETHDVRREELTNLVGPQSANPNFANQRAPRETSLAGGHGTESVPAADDKALYARLPELTSDELSRLQVLEPARNWNNAARTLTSTGLLRDRLKPWVATKRQKMTDTSPNGIPITSFGIASSATIVIQKSSALDRG